LRHEQPLEIGDEITIGSEPGLVRTIEPVLGERELRLVVQLRRGTAFVIERLTSESRSRGSRPSLANRA